MTPYNKVLTGRHAIKFVEKTLGYPEEELLAFPKFIQIETVNICNARCIMCGIEFSKKKKTVMSDSLFDKITTELAQHSRHVRKVHLYWDGEPLLDKKLPLRIKKMKDAGIETINISSNASLLDCEMATQIINAGLDQIYINVDSLKKKVYETIRLGLKFETVYKNTIDFIKLRNKLNPKLNIRIQMILQELNYREENAFVKHWITLLNPNDQVIVQKAHNWCSRVEVMEFDDPETINNIPCISLWGSFCIHADGTVGLCCMDTYNNMTLGNVNSQTISEIWASNVLKRAREKHISGKRYEISMCDGCAAWRETKHDREKIVGANRDKNNSKFKALQCTR